MKKIFLSAILLLSSIIIYAQRKVIEYMGIPIDGTKSEMIRKLQAKGGEYISAFDWVEMKNGNRTSYITINTYNDKVWRLVITPFGWPTSDEAKVKAHYNDLCNMCEGPLYYPIREVLPISDEENIAYEMKVHNKKYSIACFSIPYDYMELFWNDRDSLTSEQLNNITMRRCWSVIQLYEDKPYVNPS